MTTLLQTRDLTIGYRAQREVRVVARQVAVALEAGQLICLLGPNGAGKSTLLRTLVGAQKPLGGAIWLGDERLDLLSVRELAKRVSVVLTERIDVGLLSVYDLIALGRYPYTGFTGRLTASDRAAVARAIELTYSEDLIHRPIAQLSDGERQRVMVARAVAQEPQVMVLDEPTAFLDLPRRVALLGLLRRLAHETGRGILVATHELDIALSVADRIWLFLADGELHTGLPEELVLAGTFQRAFSGLGLTFDAYKGVFTLPAVHLRPVALHGEGLVARWTAHALERSGFEVMMNAQNWPLAIHIEGDGADVRWRLAADGQHSVVTSLAALLDSLPRLPSTPSAP